jgi:hypothetical protein
MDRPGLDDWRDKLVSTIVERKSQRRGRGGEVRRDFFEGYRQARRCRYKNRE